MVRRIIPDIVKDQDLLVLPESTPLRDAARAMMARNVRSVLVGEDGRLVGIFTGSDLIRAVAEGADLEATPLAIAMSRDPETIRPETSAIDALRCMHERRCRHLPVTDADGQLVGIVSRRDFLGHEIDEEEHQDRLWEKI